MSAPVVSVVIPLYNRASTIRRAIQSILDQSVQDLEVLVVDDGSKDGGDREVEKIASQEARVRLIRHETNRGAQAARNTAIRQARAPWIAFLDSDDYWLEDSLVKRLDQARIRKTEVVYAEGLVLYPNEAAKPYEVPAHSGWIYKELLKSEGPMFQSLLVTKKALEKIGGLDESIVAFQEWDTVIRLAQKFPFAFVPDPTYAYDCRGTDTISTQMRRGGKGYEQILHKHWKGMFFQTGAWTLIRHYEAAAGWYDRGEDAESAARCRSRARFWRLWHPGSVLHKIAKPFHQSEMETS